MKISCKQNQCHENYANIRKYKSNRICMDDSARKSTSKVSCCKISKRPTWNRNHFKFGTEKYSNIDNRYKHIFQVFDRKLKSCHSSCPDPGGVLGYVISGRVDFRLSTFVFPLLSRFEIFSPVGRARGVKRVLPAPLRIDNDWVCCRGKIVCETGSRADV